MGIGIALLSHYCSLVLFVAKCPPARLTNIYQLFVENFSNRSLLNREAQIEVIAN